ARLADRLDRPRLKLRRVRIAGLSRGAGSNSARTMGSVVLARHEPGARVPPHYSAAGLSHRAAADDKRFRFLVQRHLSRLRDFSLGIGYRLSRTRERVRPILVAGRGCLDILFDDESTDGALGAQARAQIAKTRGD